MQTLDSRMNDLDAEASVLGAIFLDQNVLDEIHFLEARDFALVKHELIYRVMLFLRKNDTPIDLVTVTEHFHKHNKLDAMGGVEYLGKLANSCPSSSNAKYYADIVRSKAIRRRGRDAGEKLIEAALYGEFETDEDFITAAEELVSELRPKAVAKMRSFAESRKDYYEHLKSKVQKLKTGFAKFDEWAQIWRGWLYVLAGRPSVGKTAYALQLGAGIVEHNPGAGCLMIYSQEMDEDELKDRLISNISGISYSRIINKGGENGFADDEQRRIDAAYDKLSKLPIYIQDSAGVTIDEIRSTAKQMLKQHGKIAAIIVDYLQIMEIPQKKNEQRHQAIGRVTKEAKTMARKMKLCFILLSQMTRESENRDEPKLSDLKESGSIEQDADLVHFLWFNGQMHEGDKVIESIFAKGRNVGTARFKLRFQGWRQKYLELEKQESTPKPKPKPKGLNRNERSSH